MVRSSSILSLGCEVESIRLLLLWFFFSDEILRINLLPTILTLLVYRHIHAHIK